MTSGCWSRVSRHGAWGVDLGMGGPAEVVASAEGTGDGGQALKHICMLNPHLEDAAQHPEDVDDCEGDAIPAPVHQPVCGLRCGAIAQRLSCLTIYAAQGVFKPLQ